MAGGLCKNALIKSMSNKSHRGCFDLLSFNHLAVMFEKDSTQDEGELLQKRGCRFLPK